MGAFKEQSLGEGGAELCRGLLVLNESCDIEMTSAIFYLIITRTLKMFYFYLHLKQNISICISTFQHFFICKMFKGIKYQKHNG